MLWADTWRVAHRPVPIEAPLFATPLSLNQDDPRRLLEEWELGRIVRPPSGRPEPAEPSARAAKGREEVEMGGWVACRCRPATIPKDGGVGWPWEVRLLAGSRRRRPLAGAPAASGKPSRLADELAGEPSPTLEPQPDRRACCLHPGGKRARPLVPLLQPRDDRRRHRRSGHPACPRCRWLALWPLGSNLPGSGSAWAGCQRQRTLACWRPGSAAAGGDDPLWPGDAQLRAASSARKPTASIPCYGPGSSPAVRARRACAGEERDRATRHRHTTTGATVARRVAPARACLGARHTRREALSSGSLRFSLQAEADSEPENCRRRRSGRW